MRRFLFFAGLFYRRCTPRTTIKSKIIILSWPPEHGFIMRRGILSTLSLHRPGKILHKNVRKDRINGGLTLSALIGAHWRLKNFSLNKLTVRHYNVKNPTPTNFPSRSPAAGKSHQGWEHLNQSPLTHCLWRNQVKIDTRAVQT